jgi:hypothetical protein
MSLTITVLPWNEVDFCLVDSFLVAEIRSRSKYGLEKRLKFRFLAPGARTVICLAIPRTKFYLR